MARRKIFVGRFLLYNSLDMNLRILRLRLTNSQSITIRKYIRHHCDCRLLGPSVSLESRLIYNW